MRISDWSSDVCSSDLKTVGVINIDAIGVYGKARDLVVVGKGNSELEDILKAQTDKQGRMLVEESTPESGFYFRSDHFNFAKAGVPALYTDSGEDLVEGGSEAGERSEEHTSELQSLMRNSYAVFCLNKKT